MTEQSNEKIPISSSSADDIIQMRISDRSEFVLERPARNQQLELPPNVLRQALVEVLDLAKRGSPPNHWTTAEEHYAGWNDGKKARLTKDFNEFLKVFIYLISLEHERTENAIWWKLKKLGLIDNKPL